MVVLIAGATHTGKTAAAQRLLEKYGYPYLSIDHLKMGLIRSGQTALDVCDDRKLTPYLWPIVREMVKTAIENRQNLIVEGCYIPFDWQKDFGPEYLSEIQYRCLIMSKDYLLNNFAAVEAYADIIEKRLYDSVSQSELIEENEFNLRECKRYGLRYILIDEAYAVDIEL